RAPFFKECGLGLDRGNKRGDDIDDPRTEFLVRVGNLLGGVRTTLARAFEHVAGELPAPRVESDRNGIAFLPDRRSQSLRKVRHRIRRFAGVLSWFADSGESLRSRRVGTGGQFPISVEKWHQPDDNLPTARFPDHPRSFSHGP